MDIAQMGQFLPTQGWQITTSFTPCCILENKSYFRTSVPFWGQQAPSYETKRSGNTVKNSLKFSVLLYTLAKSN